MKSHSSAARLQNIPPLEAEGQVVSLIHGKPSAQEKFNLSTRETVRLLGSVRLFQRLRHSMWLTPLIPSSRDALYPYSRILAAQQKMERGEYPPLLPCEQKAQQQREQAKLRRLSVVG
jgi:hypothetical protein